MGIEGIGKKGLNQFRWDLILEKIIVKNHITYTIISL